MTVVDSGTGPVRTPVSEQPGAGSVPETCAAGLGELVLATRFQVTEEELGEAARVSVYEGGDHAWDDVTAQMMRSSCAFMAQELLRGPLER